MSSGDASNRVVLTVGEPNIRWSHLYLAEHVRSGFFPPDAVGERNAEQGTGRPLTVWFAGVGYSLVQTDIGGEHKVFRGAGPPARILRASPSPRR